MIKSTKATYLRTSLLLLSFALLLFITACGGSIDDSDAESAKGGTISLAATSSSVSAGQSSIITVTVLDGAGGFAKNESVTFTIIDNKSGATITPLNNGKTDAKGQAIATYKAGSNNPGSEVQDSIQASISGATNVIIITRTSASSTAYQLSLTADSTTITPGTTTIVRATVTDGGGNAVYGQAVTFSFLSNKSAATLTTLSLGATDTSGQALAIYTAGTATPTQSVQDTIQASIAGATGVVIITRSAGGTSASGLLMTLNADAPSLAAGQSTIVRAKVTDGLGTAVQGQPVSFTFISNQSGGTINALNSGITDASGQAIATYTAGANSSSASVQDTIQASLTGTVAAIIITRTAGGGTSSGMILTLTAASTTVEGGESTILTAKVTNGSGSTVQGEAVNFGFAPGGNQSGAAINVLSGTTDAAGEATALYAAGTLTGATVQDIVQASITGSTKALIITKTGTASGVTASSLDLTASPVSIKTDGSSSSTITVTALNALNASLSGVVVTVGTDTGVLSAATVTTPGNVTLTCGSNKANRTATITATAGSATKQIPVQIVGSTVTLATGASSISTTGSTTVTVTVKDAGSNVVPGAAVSLSSSGTGTVTFGSATGTTNASGVFSTTVAGNTNGTVNITATALGATASTAITVTDSATVFYIDRQRFCTDTTFPIDTSTCTTITGNPNPTAMQLGQNMEIEVNAPAGITNVVFATTGGTFHDVDDSPNGNVITIPVSGGKAIAYLTTTQAGIATVNVYDAAASSTNDTLSVAMTSATAASIELQASPVVVPKSVGTTTGSSTLIAMVRDTNGFPVGNAAVAFSIVNPTGGGETISPVVAMSAPTTAGGLNLGEARASFTSGSLPTGAGGIQVRASIVGSSAIFDDATIVIGGVAGSIAFGQATSLGVDSTNANYTLAMSVMVSDSNGNPAPAGTIVNLSLWPIAWSTGSGCMYDMDGFRYNSLTEDFDIPCDTCGTFWNEDYLNENLILDASEDGARYYYADSSHTAVAPTAGTKDGYITPVNSAAGTVPATVTTDASGVAGFTLTYPKNSAIWTIDRLRASTIVQGTETVGQVTFRLDPLASDVTPTCRITGSPYNF